MEILQKTNLNTGKIPAYIGKKKDLKSEIYKLKKRKGAIILSHYYQDGNIQDIADFTGDSLGLAQQAAKARAKIIVFAGVHFMAETVKIIAPDKKVLLPDLNAGCSLADSCPEVEFRKLIEKHPGHLVISYINCSAGIKAMSDIICTSSNALKIIESIPKRCPIIFTPDKNLGKYLIRKTEREMVLWEGECEVHKAFSMLKLKNLMDLHPDAKIAAHPESEMQILNTAHFIGSTAAMLEYIKTDNSQKYIIATEAGILYQMKRSVPYKTLIPAPTYEDNSCACSECSFMKLNTLEKLYDCLEFETPEITVPEKIRERALLPIQRMLEIS